MRSVWTPVKVKTEEHARFGTAGYVCKVDPERLDEVVVKFDADGVEEATKIADLQAL